MPSYKSTARLPADGRRFIARYDFQPSILDKAKSPTADNAAPTGLAPDSLASEYVSAEK